MTTTHTVPERLVMMAAALVSLAVAAVVTARVVPVYRLLNHAEAVSAVGLLASAGLLSLGVVLIVDWRRKRRARKPRYFTGMHLGTAWESALGGPTTVEWSQRECGTVDLFPEPEWKKVSFAEALAADPPQWARSEDDFRNAPIDDHGYIDFGALRPFKPMSLDGLPTVEEGQAGVDRAYHEFKFGSWRQKHKVDPTSELQRHLTDALAVMLRHPQLVVDAGTLKLLARRPKPIRDEKGRWRRVQ